MANYFFIENIYTHSGSRTTILKNNAVIEFAKTNQKSRNNKEINSKLPGDPETWKM